MPLLACAVAGFLAGSIPTGYLLVRLLKGEDIRRHGSGNIGASNVARVLGSRSAGVAVFLADCGKGFLPAGAVLLWFSGEGRHGAIAAGAAAVLGHCYTPWLAFRGGKGVATGCGALLAVAPRATLCAMAIWIAVAVLLRYASVASMTATASLVGWVAVFHDDPWGGDRDLFAFAIAAALLVFWRHRSNLARLCQGTEPRMGRRTAPTAPAGETAS